MTKQGRPARSGRPDRCRRREVEGPPDIVLREERTMEMVTTTSMPGAAPGECRFELQFISTCAGGHDYAFPCDEHGQVDMDALTERVRTEYLFARAVMGRDVARPVVVSLPARRP
jgi:hypothetical protein